MHEVVTKLSGDVVLPLPWDGLRRYNLSVERGKNCDNSFGANVFYRRRDCLKKHIIVSTINSCSPSVNLTGTAT